MDQDSIDRLPNRSDSASTTIALLNFRTKYNLIDGWQSTNLTEKVYTHIAKGHNTQARLDRIYTTNNIHKMVNDWKIEVPAVKTDHKLVSVRITNPKSPEMGKGRWSMPLLLLKNKKFLLSAQELRIELQNVLRNLIARSPEHNTQEMFTAYQKNSH